MSKETKTFCQMEELACPKCGHKHKMKKYSRINVTEKPGLKEEILQNKIFFFRCEECEMSAPLTYESCYVDSKKKLVICLSPEGEPTEEMKTWQDRKEMTRRIVDNINDFKEKILIADSHLDDRVIELVKIQYLRQLDREMENDTLMNILFDSYGNAPGFLVFFEKKGVGRLPLNRELYQKTKKDYEKQIQAHSTDAFMKIDMEWAGNIFFKRH